MTMHGSALWPHTTTIDSQGHLLIGGCDLVALAQKYGTPLYVLDEATIRRACQAYRQALAQHYPGPSSIHYASKALLNTAIAQLVASEGLGLDVVSGGELFVALHAGVAPERIHLHGNAKPRRELEQALAVGVGRIMVDNLDELDLLIQLTANRSTPQSIDLRLTPEIATNTHAHIQTGHAASKFGFPLAELNTVAERLRDATGLRLRGLHAHLGSQLFEPDIYREAIEVLLDCAAYLQQDYQLTIDEISPGGGLGVPYTADQEAPDLAYYASTIGDALASGATKRGLPLPCLMIEPGRSIIARAGVAIYEVVGRKHFTHHDASSVPIHDYLHIDGGMGDNIRPALYQARYTALLANRADAEAQETVNVSGRYCESGDILLHDLALPAAQPGDLLAVAVAGAYTLSMASNYNLVPRPAVLLLADGNARLIQRRETYDDLIARDVP